MLVSNVASPWMMTASVRAIPRCAFIAVPARLTAPVAVVI